MIKRITCRGTPYEIGHSHGSGAVKEIENCIAFYADLFVKNSSQSWEQVQETARAFEIGLKTAWPRYYEEMRGIADGANRDILDIVAINVRTEIAFGLFSDGCTSLFWRTPNHVFLGQNWDWMEAQKQNLILLSIYQDSLPTIKMVTEAGIIGKIGLNSAGVGVCLNAIRAKGMEASRIPAHIGLRIALESRSAAEAVEKLESKGMASSAHILIGDGTGEAIGFEFTSSTTAKLPVSDEGHIVHTNHLIAEHEGAIESLWLEDSPVRLARMTSLVRESGGGDPGWEGFSRLFEDRDGHPGAICRAQEGKSKSATLFNIVMDLRAKQAVVRVGKPSDVEELPGLHVKRVKDQDLERLEYEQCINFPRLTWICHS